MHPRVEQLEQQRFKLNLSIYRISKDLNIGMPTLANLFKGKNEPKIGLYFKVEEYLKNKEV